MRRVMMASILENQLLRTKGPHMKKILITLIALIALPALAHEIEGTQMLKGSLKTEIKVNYIKTTCKVKVHEVKNLMEEDQYGNPAYKVKVEVSLNGGEFLSNKKVKFEKELWMDNLFSDGVRDLEYQGEGIKLFITNEGRLAQVQVPFQYSTVTCNF